jgi:hypothetical protein
MVVYFGLVITVEIPVKYRGQILVWFLYIVSVMKDVIQSVIIDGIMIGGIMRKINIKDILRG